MKTKVISFASGKGGVGKTSLALNTGVYYASVGKRVLLIDADWTLGKLGIALGIRPQWTIEEVLKAEVTLGEAVQKVSQGLSLLASPSGPQSFVELDANGRRTLFLQIEQLYGQYDIVILDHGSGIHPSVIEFVAASHLPVIVTTPEPTSYTDAYAIMKSLSKQFAVRDFGLVVTNASPSMETENIVDRFCDVARNHLDIRLTLLATFGWEKNLSEALRRQKPFVQLWPESEFSRSVVQLSEKLDKLKFKTRSGLQYFHVDILDSYEREGACQA